MSSILQVIDTYAADPWRKSWRSPAIREYVETGRETAFEAIPLLKSDFPPVELAQVLPPPEALDDLAVRVLRLLLKKTSGHGLGVWLARVGKTPESFQAACQRLTELGADEALITLFLGQWSAALEHATSPAGQFVAGQPTEVFRALLENRVLIKLGILESFLARTAPPNYIAGLQQVLQHASGELLESVVERAVSLLREHPGQFIELARLALEKATDRSRRFQLLQHLYTSSPEQYGTLLDQEVVRLLPGEGNVPGVPHIPWHREKELAEWLIRNRPGPSEAVLAEYFASPLGIDPWRFKGGAEYKYEALDVAASLGAAAVPWYRACFRTRQPDVQLRALKHWLALGRAEDQAELAAHLRQLLAAPDSTILARAIRLGGDVGPDVFEADLWPLLAHKSRAVREAAAGVLARLGESRLPKVREQWAAKKSDTRLAAVHFLKTLGTPAAVTELKARLDLEESDDVRDAILLALESLGQGGAADPAEFQRRVLATVAKLKGSPVPWLNLQRLPALPRTSGSPLSPEERLYLIYRQSRVKEMRADLEARPLLKSLDRSASGAFAVEVVTAFLGSKQEADDRWALALAALTGDDRLVPLLSAQIREWADAQRGKLAEYAVQALALLGTDAALLAVDAMAIRYRSKNKNIGKAAADAFAAAAAARGLTVEELGDLVVPWLGFTPNQPRLVTSPKGAFEVRIGADLKLAFREATTGKRVAKLPDSIGADAKSELKEVTANLKEAVKSQLLRLEMLMVRQFRWPGVRWLELYPRHPLLRPLAQRLVWGEYASSGALQRTFRVLEDGSLTDPTDETLALSESAQVGLVHPLELTSAQRQAWVQHLADYEVVPPFPQLDRPVVACPADQVEKRFDRRFTGTELNGMTFKGRAERLGWGRGSVCDAGMINFYWKSFPSAGVDVFVGTEGMGVGMDMYSDMTLGEAFFVRHGSVKIGSYEYDEPGEESDERLIPFGQVPAIAYSEALGDLAKISGKTTEPTPETPA
ncbi:MAG: DUF4132 domain-containing protein [Verrucomicrobia bacterium]|nr:DUF4132 domain-containing protein [Verrucomicrobiota bacterium]